MKTKIPTDEPTYRAFLQAMYKYSRLPNLTHHRSAYARRLRLVQNHIYHKTGRLHPVRRLLNQANALKYKDSPAKPATSKVAKKSQSPQVGIEALPQVASPTAHSIDPADYNHSVLSTSLGISRKRPKLVIPTLRGELPPAPTFDHRPSFSDSQPKLQLDSPLNPPSQADISPSLPYTPVEQIAHTPLLPPEMPRFPREKTNLRITLTHQSSSGCNTPILSPRSPQDPSSPLLHPSDILKPRNTFANPRPLLRPRQLSYFHSVPQVSDSTSSPKVGITLDTSSAVIRTESLASPLILFQPNLPSGLKRAL